MINKIKLLKDNKFIIWGMKVVLCLATIIMVIQAFAHIGIDPYYSYKDYDYQNNFTEDSAVSIKVENSVSQQFTAKGNILNKVSIYFGEISHNDFVVTITDSSGNGLVNKKLDLSQYIIAHSWNEIDISNDRFKRNETYVITLTSESGLEDVILSQGDAPSIFGVCSGQGRGLNGALALGFQFTYTYLTLGSGFEFILKALFSLLMVGALCFAICNFEKLYKAYLGSEKKHGLPYAIYFSVSLILLFNPLNKIRNEVMEFDRSIGGALIANEDVSQRTKNFSLWFWIFAIAFVLFYLLANYMHGKEYGKETRKVVDFLNNYVIFANVMLLLRCITYFNDKSLSDAVYYFSAMAVMLIFVIILSYVFFNLEKTIFADYYVKLLVIVTSLSYPVTIMIDQELGSGRLLLGVMSIAYFIVLLLSKYGAQFLKKHTYGLALDGGVLILTLLPLMTSVYIELIHVLNQHSIFVSRPKKYYIIAVILVFIVYACFVGLSRIKNIKVKNWKSWAYPSLVIGFAGLCTQIPIQNIYFTDIFESANSSILISDFFNYGTIPIVEHYGGHMMAGVWEGILYGLLNNDYAGAVVSPYSSLYVVLATVLFFYFVKNVWNEDIALFVTLLFPFYNFWSYYGLGMLVCLAAMSYIKKNSYVRAAILWLTFIWCALYRLDLGFAFGLAVIIAMAIYIICYRNWVALKQLLITLIGWGGIGGAVWFIICIVKGINPINRLIEFLMISLSNQNWALIGIGNSGNSIFAWSYILIPFTMVICLIYTIFSKEIREKIGGEKWVLLMIIGLSYFANFSRGLVRHSLAEMATSIVLWTANLFLAFFFSCFKNNKRLFLPIFTLLIICNTSLTHHGNFAVTSIADGAVSQPSPIMESWTLGRFDEEIYEETYPNTYWEELRYNEEVVERVKLTEDMENTVEQYETLLCTILDEEDTFVDFINKTFIYSAIGKKNPVYISQSPLQLSGEFSQKEFVKEIDGVPIVLMPIDPENNFYSNALDGIANGYRNYKVSEYIYQNYEPLCRYSNIYAVWCLTDRYEEFKEKVDSLIEGINVNDLTEELPYDYIKYGYDGPNGMIGEDGTTTYLYNGGLHNYNLDQLPRIWADFDKKKAINNEVIAEFDYVDGIYLLNNDFAPSSQGNYLKLRATYYGNDLGGQYHGDDENVSGIPIIMGYYENGNFIEKSRYNITIKEGTHDYLIRVSTDYYWYLGEENAVNIHHNGILHDVSMQILKGD